MDAKAYKGKHGRGRKGYKESYQMEMNRQIALGKHQYHDNRYEIAAEKWAQQEYRKRWRGDF